MTMNSKQARRRARKEGDRRRRARRRASSRRDDWTCLPPELLDLIARKLTIFDFIRFRSVCATWRCCCADTNHQQQLPLLILPHGEYGCTIPFFNPADRHIYEFPLPNEARGKFALGSSYGWLVMLDWQDESVSLLNPITQAHIILPPLPAAYYTSTTGALLCCNPTAPPPKQPRQLLLAIQTPDPKLLIYRDGDDYWAVIDKPPEFSRFLGGIAYLKEEAALYVVDRDGRLAVLDLASSTLRQLTKNTTPVDPEVGRLPSHRNLVATATGELLLVAWDREVGPRPQFHLFKLDKSGEGGCLKWVRAADDVISSSMLFQSGEEVILQVCNQDFIAYGGANQIYCVNGISFYGRINEIGICARVEIWDTASLMVDSSRSSSSINWWSRPLSAFTISTTTRTGERGFKSLGFTWMIPSLS